jgi:hypothetical protein
MPVVMRQDMAPYQVTRAFDLTVVVIDVRIAIIWIVVVAIVRPDKAAADEDVVAEAGTDMRPDHARMKPVATTRRTAERKSASVPAKSAMTTKSAATAVSAKSTARLRYARRDHTKHCRRQQRHHHLTQHKSFSLPRSPVICGGHI